VTPAPPRSKMLKYAESRGLHYGTDPGAYDPSFVASAMPAFQALFGPDKWFDVHAQGWDNIPDGPAMLVSNHSGGTLVTDGLGLGTAWYTHFGEHRPLHGLAHEMVFATKGIGHFLERCGAIRAGHATAARAFDMGRHIVVMPGGDQDVWRPSSKRYRVQFAGRTGYVRVAMKTGAPIVPTAHVGAHNTLWVLTDGQRFARKVKFIRDVARAEIFPVHLSFPWGLAVGPWPHVPPPTRYDYRFGEPIAPRGHPDNPDDVAEMDARVQFAIQEMLDEMRRERARRPVSIRTMVRRAQEGIASVQQLAEVLRAAGVDPEDLPLAAK